MLSDRAYSGSRGARRKQVSLIPSPFISARKIFFILNNDSHNDIINVRLMEMQFSTLVRVMVHASNVLNGFPL